MRRRKATAEDTGLRSGDSRLSPARPRHSNRVWLLVIILVGLTGVVWWSGVLAVFPRQIARRCLSSRDFEGALRWHDIASRICRQSPDNALLLARIARQKSDRKSFQQALTLARRWGADPALVRRQEILAQSQAGELEEVEGELVRELARSGAAADEISEAYANGLAMNARFDDALSVLDAWRKDFPDDPRPDYRIGRIQEHREMYLAAETSYRRSISRDSRFYPARYSLGRVLLHERRGEEAVEMFRSCLAMQRPEAVQVELAVALKSLGELDEARALLRSVVEADTALLRDSYMTLDQQPEGFKAAAEYGRLETDAGNFAEACKWLEIALARHPQDLMARYALAVSLRGLGKLEEAEKHFTLDERAREALQEANSLSQRIKAEPGDLEARLSLGKLVLDNESERTGIYWIKSIFAFDPNYAPAHEALADYYAARADDQLEFAELATYHRNRAQQISKPHAPNSRGSVYPHQP